ncbi:MAG: cache domain-containing protein [Bacteroidales bacterium]
MDAAAVVEKDGEGYIDYMWQWKDDTTLVAPKLSFVKGFEPWGWIIGTGIYLDDVNREIKHLERSILWTSFIILMVILLALLFIIRSSMQIENRRRETEKKLLLSRQKYRNLVESSTIGTLMMAENRIIYVNQKFVDISGCTRDNLLKMGVEDLFNREWAKLVGMFGETNTSVNIEARIETDPDRHDLLLSVSRVEYGSGFSYIFAVNELSEARIVSRHRESLDENLCSALLLMDLPENMIHTVGKEGYDERMGSRHDHNFIVDLLKRWIAPMKSQPSGISTARCRR